MQVSSSAQYCYLMVGVRMASGLSECCLLRARVGGFDVRCATFCVCACVCSTAFYKHLRKCSVTREAVQRTHKGPQAHTRKHPGSRFHDRRRQPQGQNSVIEMFVCLLFHVKLCKVHIFGITAARFPASSPLSFIHMFII